MKLISRIFLFGLALNAHVVYARQPNIYDNEIYSKRFEFTDADPDTRLIQNKILDTIWEAKSKENALSQKLASEKSFCDRKCTLSKPILKETSEIGIGGNGTFGGLYEATFKRFYIKDGKLKKQSPAFTLEISYEGKVEDYINVHILGIKK